MVEAVLRAQRHSVDVLNKTFEQQARSIARDLAGPKLVRRKNETELEDKSQRVQNWANQGLSVPSNSHISGRAGLEYEGVARAQGDCVPALP